MGKDKVKLGCSKQQFYKMLQDEVSLYIQPHEGFRLKEFKNGIILKPQRFLQKGVNFVNCKFTIENINSKEIEVKTGYSLSIFGKLLLTVLMLMIYFAIDEIITKFDSEILFCIILFPVVPTFFYLNDRISCQNFWKHFLGELKVDKK